MMKQEMKQDHNEVIDLLAFCYPKAFFRNPHCRVALKIGIEKDIAPQEIAEAARHPVDIWGAVRWYRSHFGYLNQIQAGNHRIDLHGNRVGTVTLDDENAAKEKLKNGVKLHREKMRERRQMMNGNDELPGFIRRPTMPTTVQPATIAKPEPAPAVVKPEPAPTVLTIAKPEPAVAVVKPEPAPAVVTNAKPEPAPAVVIKDERLRLARKRIELADSMTDDRECAALVLKSVLETIQQTIDQFQGRRSQANAI